MALKKETVNIDGINCIVMQFPFADQVRISCKLAPFAGLLKGFIKNKKTVSELLDSNLKDLDIDGLIDALIKLMADDESILTLLRKILSYTIVNDKSLATESNIDEVFEGNIVSVIKLAFKALTFNSPKIEGAKDFFTKATTTKTAKEVVIAKEKA